jgi:menaquinone-dependent protoporphyrinogen IX oxidase
MKKICILYDSVSGSTVEIADILKNELSLKSHKVDIVSIINHCDLNEYDVVIIGSPLRFGSFTPRMRKFIRKNKERLMEKPLFIYITLLYIVGINNIPDFKVPCYIDPSLGIRVIEKKDASPFDMGHSLGYYHNKIDNHLSGILPLGVALFNGRLVLKRLPLLERLFMKLALRLTTKEKAGDFINPEAVRAWAADISSYMN